MINFDEMSKKAQRYNIELSSEQLNMLDKYAEMLVEWNFKINLTAITDSEGIMTRHFEDSIAMLKYVDSPINSSLIDIGTGAGFPGMVLKIIRPDLKITLLDSLNKRISFLNTVSDKLCLDINTVHLRAEDGGKLSKYRERFDIACARAVSNMRELSEYCIPYVKVGGQFVSLKGPDVVDELVLARPAIGTLGGKVNSVCNYTISDGSGRNIIIVDKVKPTPIQFPRISAKIAKKPL